jgi:hypothetical protein
MPDIAFVKQNPFWLICLNGRWLSRFWSCFSYIVDIYRGII